ncbi:MAG: AAA family ATPase [Dehalococcoidia bacterium]|nr:AAA family ATPase [Dehalococcoidia bacterium]
MKVAVSGKGGVGKTTVAALLATALARANRKVIAVDADPDSNLAACLGHPHPEEIRPLIELHDLIEERTGVKPGTRGAMFKLNPRVDDIPDEYGVDIAGVKVLILGQLKQGGAGCYCPENALLLSLTTHLLLDPDCDLILDMEAGIEHLTRGTVAAVDRLLIIVEPGRRSLETARRIMALAQDLGLKKVGVVLNKVSSPLDERFVRDELGETGLIASLPYSEELRRLDREQRSIAAANDGVGKAINDLLASLRKD